MSKKLTSAELNQLITDATNSIKCLFSKLLFRKTEEYNKKASLIAYWLIDYVKYIINETKFRPDQLVSYRKGRIVLVNFGFRIGNELGGLHYAIVIDNNNSHHSGIITVIPLSSIKTSYKENKYSFKLQTGIYQLVADKVKNEAFKIKQSIAQLDEERNLKLAQFQNNEISLDEYKQFENYKNNKVKQWNIDIAIMMKHLQQMQNLKTDTIVNVSQITTVSKMRIYSPKTNKDLLFGIKLSDNDINTLKDKLKKLYLF